MPGNTTFFAKASEQSITWKDIFSDVFKKHSREDGERLFASGTMLTTPHESRMIAQWEKPWLFARVGLYGLLFLALMYGLFQVSSIFYSGLTNDAGTIYSSSIIGVYVPVLFVGALLMPLVVVLLIWELNIPRNIPIYSILGMLFIGGGLSLAFTFIFGLFDTTTGVHWAPLTEEPAKLAALCVFLYKPKYKYALNGILIGAAIGAGFGAMETMKYGLQYGFLTLVLRGILAPGMHVVWAATYGGALALAKGAETLRTNHFSDKLFLTHFAVAFGLHFAWNYDGFYIHIFEIYPGVSITVKHILLTVIAWLMLLSITKHGVVQCMRVPQIAPSHTPQMTPAIASAASAGMFAAQSAPAYAMSGEITLRGLSGPYKGQMFPCSNGSLIIGRDNRVANVVFPPNAPGVSSVHCEITYQNGIVYITDKNSSNGTFLADGTRLIPGTPYPLSRRSGFYLATRENMFEIE